MDLNNLFWVFCVIFCSCLIFLDIFLFFRINISRFVDMKNATQSYMVVLFGDFRRKEQKMSNIIYGISPLANSKDVRFVYSESHIIIHFTSDFEFEELKRLLDLAIHNECDLYLFFNYNEKFSVKMQPPIFTHLFDWNVNSESVNMDLRENELSNTGVGPNQDDIKIIMMDMGFDPFAELQETLFKKPRTKKNELPLDVDTILEKISLKGIDSLTKREKEFLKNISNNEES